MKMLPEEYIFGELILSEFFKSLREDYSPKYLLRSPANALP